MAVIKPSLSNRAEKLDQDVGQLFDMQMTMQNDMYDRDLNPNGFINLAVAENTINNDELLRFFESNFRLSAKDLTYHDALSGTTRLYNALAGLLNTSFRALKPVTSDHIVSFVGCGSALDNLGRATADDGERILLAEPYYLGFDMEFTIQSNVVPLGLSIPLGDMFTLREVDHMEKELERLQPPNSKRVIKSLLICNPHNPLGKAYPVDVILAYGKLAEKYNIHLISDEIYAMSVFPSKDVPSPNPFNSVLSLDFAKNGVDPSRVHVIYGMSKDFNANGFRIGTVISQHNPALIRSISVTAMFSMVSAPSDILWSALLNDKEALQAFLGRNKRNLTTAYDYAVSWMDFHQIPHLTSSAGHFLMLNFRPVLSNVERYGAKIPIKSEMSMEEREEAFLAFLMQNKVMLTPGKMFHFGESGWFRFTFATRRDVVNIGLRRLEKLLGWDECPTLTA